MQFGYVFKSEITKQRVFAWLSLGMLFIDYN